MQNLALVALLAGLAAARALSGATAQAASAGSGSSLTLQGGLGEIPAGHWVYRSLNELITAGLVVEYRPGMLEGERTISRYEAALLLVDAFRRADAVRPSEEGGPGPVGGWLD